MEIKNNLDFLISEAKHLQKLKILNENMVNNYEINIFPSTIEKYYQIKLSLFLIQIKDNTIKNANNKLDIFLNKKIELNKELLSIEKSKSLLGSFYYIVTDFFISLRNNEKIILYILENINEESKNLLINYISLLFFENVFDIEKKNCNEIFLNRILEHLIEKELENIINNGNNYSKFLDGTLAAKIIKNFLKKDDVQNYLRDIFLDIITDISEMENKNVFMEPNRIRDYLMPKEKTKEENLNIKGINNKNVKKKKTIKEALINNPFQKTVNKILHFDKNDNNTMNKSFVINNQKKVHKLSCSNIINNNNDFDIILNKNSNTNNDCNIDFTSLTNITNFLYEGLTHSRLIYSDKQQKIFLNYNEQENNCYNYYKIINIDKFLEIKENIPEINKNYTKCDLSHRELNNLLESNKSNKYMKQFYCYQIKEFQKDPNKNFSNMSFIKALKSNYLLYLNKLIPIYKKNFEKIKYFIDKMIYKMLQSKNDTIPLCIKSIIIAINNYLIKKDKKISQIEINRYICEFLIGKIIIPFLTNEELIYFILGKKIDRESKTFLFYFAKIIKRIFRGNFYESIEHHFTIFNIYLCEIEPYINLIVLNIISSNNNSKNEIDININKEGDNSKTINKIIKYDSIVINKKILIIILDFLNQHINNVNDLNMQKLLSLNYQLKEHFKLVSESYNDIIQIISQNSDINDNIKNEPFFILMKEEISRQKSEPISLSTYNNKLINSEVLPRLKYSLIKLFELIPSNLIINNYQLIINKKIIQIFIEIKKNIGKMYSIDFINENNIIEKEKEISIIWYIDYFLNYYNYLSDDYKNNAFEKLFQDIGNDLKNEIILYQNDLSEYIFNLLLDDINEKIASMNYLFNYYYNNAFSYKIHNYSFNTLKIKVDIFEYLRDQEKYIYFNKSVDKENKEIVFLKVITIENISEFIKYISNHIINENILINFTYIGKTSKKNLSQINNINTFLNDYMGIIKNNIKHEIKNKMTENNNTLINNEQEIIEEKEKLDEAMNIIEELIHEGIYTRIWKNNNLNADIELNEICKNKLINISPTNLGINEKYINEHIWKNIIYLMNTKYNINNYKTPMSKIKCIENIYNIINKSLNVITNKTNDKYSVDDIFPIFVYLLIKIKPEHLIINLNFIRLLINKKNLIKSSGFALAQLEMAVQYIQNIEISQVKI